MGKFKPLMKYTDKTFLHHIIIKLDTICSQIIIVTGFNSEKLQSETIKTLKDQKKESVLKKIKFAENPNFEKGMFTSLQRGLKEVRDLNLSSRLVNWILYHFVDQPGLPAEFYSSFIDQLDNAHNWIQPSYNSRHGHPILISSDLFNFLLEADESSNLKELSKNQVVKKSIWNCSYKNVLQDIDTEEDYIANIDIE